MNYVHWFVTQDTIELDILRIFYIQYVEELMIPDPAENILNSKFFIVWNIYLSCYNFSMDSNYVKRL